MQIIVLTFEHKLKTIMKTNQNTKSKFKYAPMLLILVITFLISSCDKKDDNVVPEMQQPVDISVALQQITDNPDSFYGEISDLKKQSLKEKKPKFKFLIQALVKSNLVSTVAKNELTVFAPTDEAFQNLFDALGVNGINDLTAEQLTPILLYHVIGGKVMSNDLSDGFFETVNGAKIQVDLSNGVMINDANVTIADIHAANGVIHIIDKVLLPPSMNLVEKAISFNPEFSILVDAVVKAGLDETLANDGPFTVFAPTNAAFEALFSQLGVNGVDDLTAEQLTPILLYHVVEGSVFSTDLANGMVPTLNGSDIQVDLSSGVMINDASVVQANVQATNGVIHVIDKVLIP